jgi:hypothetical protein
MDRRSFLKCLGLAGLAAVKSSQATPSYKIRTISQGPKHHFFGYYGICPWNHSQTHLLALETDFQDHMPGSNDKAAIGLIDLKSGRFEKLTATLAWNFQQGAMLHWNPARPDSEIFFNDKKGDQIVSKKFNIQTGNTRILPRPINGLSHNGRYALSLTYGRLGRLRNVVGYSGMTDPNEHEPYPDDDGVFLLDMNSGQSKLIVSIRQVNDLLLARGLDLRGSHMWFNHVVFNTSDSRLLFLARAWRPEYLPHLRNLATGMFTVNIDGTELREAIPFEYGVSHFDWRNDHEIVATFQDVNDQNRFKHFMFTDGERNFRVLGDGELNFDGHCVFSPDPQMIATDKKMSKENRFRQHLYIFDMQKDQLIKAVDLDMFEKKNISGNLRCDFHPRWNRTGDSICFDALAPDRTRQLHIASQA